MNRLESPRLLSALLSITLVVLAALALATGYVLSKQTTATERLARAITHQHQSLDLAGQLRRSSDDLTRMVRSYAATGDATFREHFYTILDIRDGKAPRPPQVEGVSLRELMVRAGFSDEELHLLTEAKRQSDRLVELEETAMNALEGRFRDDEGLFTVEGDPDRELALQLLFGEEYHQAKSAIMKPIAEVLEGVHERTSAALAMTQDEQASLRSALVCLLGALLVVLPLLIVVAYGYYKTFSTELTRSEECFRSTFEQAAVGIVHVSTVGRFLRLNDRFCDIVGYTRDELLTRTFQEITHSDDLDADLERTQRLLRGGQRTYSMEKRYLHKDGETVWVNLTVSLLRADAGDPRWFVAVVEDITERKQAEARIQAYKDRLRALAADLIVTEERERRRIAKELHDGAVQALASARMRQDAATKLAGNREQAEALDEVSQLLRQTALEVSQIASDLSSPSLSELGLAAAISAWMKDYVGKDSGIETELVNELGEEDGRRIDFVTRAILFRNVRELLANVVQHAGECNVGVILKRVGNRLELVVRDDGVGCDPEQALADAGDRAAFGLFSVRERMVDLRGTLKLESEPGLGFTATLVLPSLSDVRSPEIARSAVS